VTLAQHAGAVLARLEDDEDRVRERVLQTLGKLEPATLAQYSAEVIARREDDHLYVRMAALQTLGKLEPATLAKYANALVARLEDSDSQVRLDAVETLGIFEPAALARHAGAVLAMLEDDDDDVRYFASDTLGKLEPATLAQYAADVLARLEDPDDKVRKTAYFIIRTLPCYVLRGVTLRVVNLEVLSRGLDRGTYEYLRSHLLGRIAWYRCRICLRVRSLSLYWYALPYHPSGPGHARDVEAWGHVIEELRT